MKIKKFTAKDMSEAMTKIRAELGKDAVILNSKRVDTGGFLGFFTKKNIEVIAAIDPEVRRNPVKKRIEEKTLPASSPAYAEKDKNRLEHEIRELKSMVRDIQPSGIAGNEDYPAELSPFNRLLIDQEVHDHYRLPVMKAVLKKWYKEEEGAADSDKVTEWLNDELTGLLSNAEFGGVKYTKKYLNVVGPTGVGKTTSIAKIAARAVLEDKKKTALITTDTFRIAAIEQLKTYAKILDIPVEVAYSISDFKDAVEKLKDYDFVLVDSAGRNFRNPLYVEQLNQLIDFNEETETHLVLALTSKYRDMKKIIEQFQLIEINKLIFSKLDETDSVGAMVNVTAEYGLGASYLATGQNVPDDIEEASAEKIIRKLLRS